MKTPTKKPTKKTDPILDAIASKDGGYSLLTIACQSLDIYAQSVDRDYSGRGMYGDTCVAFTIEDIGDAECIARQVSRLSEKAGKRVGASIDSMGRSFVVYCPSLSIEDASE